MSGFLLATECLKLLLKRKRLLIAPLLGALSSLVTTALFFHLITFFRLVENGPLVGSLTLLFGFFQNYLLLFSNAVAIHMISESLEGRTPCLKDSGRFALSRWDKLLAWAGLSSMVGMVAGRIARGEKQSGARASVARSTKKGWKVLSYLAFPILILENRSPKAAAARSVALIVDSWGLGKRARYTLESVAFVLFVLVALLVVLAKMLGDRHGEQWMIVGLGAAAVVAFASFFLLECLGQVFRVVLYRYATKKERPGGFSLSVVEGAFEVA